MVDRTKVPNAFEFVVLAGARAHQLLRGCTPRVTSNEKLVRIAQREVRERKVVKIEPGTHE